MGQKRIEFDGRIHEFPDDFTDEDISAALSAPTPPPQPAAGRGTQFNQEQAQRNFGAIAPFAGGAVGGLVAGIPGAAVGGMTGQAIKAASQNRAPGVGELVMAGGANAVGQAAGPFVARGVVGAGKYVAGKAVPLVRSAIKPTVASMRQQSGAAMTGVNAQANRLAGILVKNRWTKPEQASEAVQAAEKQLQDVLSGADDVALDTATRVPRYLGKLERSARTQIMPSHDVSAVRGANQSVLSGPLAEDVTTTTMKPSPSGLVDETGRPFQVPVDETTRALRTDVTPSEGLTIARGTGRWGNRKAWGELKGAEQEASKTAERAVRDSVKEAVPAAKPILQREGDALRAFPALDRMAFREDQISLPAWVMASGGGGATRTAGALLANYIRNNQLSMGVRAAGLGQALTMKAGSIGTMSAEALRAALLAALSGDATSESAPPRQP
jgi:hypothetical protein